MSEAPPVKLRPDKVVWRQVGDEVMVLDTGSSQYLSVNPTGTYLWPMLIEGCPRPQLVQALVDKFDIDEQTASSDVEKFLSSLQDLGLLEGAEG